MPLWYTSAICSELEDARSILLCVLRLFISLMTVCSFIVAFKYFILIFALIFFLGHTWQYSVATPIWVLRESCDAGY